MANSTSNIDLIAQAQASKEVTSNGLSDAASPAMTYGRRQSTCSGLTFGYYGGNVTLSGGAMSQIANGTLTLTASATNYIVANKATGAVSFSTATTNWNDSANYWRLYSAVVGAATVTSYIDSRELAKYTGGGGGSGDMVLASAQTNTGAKTFKSATLLLRNVADTFSSLFTNAVTADRTWTLPDKDGTVAMLSDITGTNSGVNTGDETAASIKTKLGVTTLSGSNTGDQTLAGLGGVSAASPNTSGTLTHSGDIILSGSGKRITGDLSNPTVSNRLMFQSSTGTYSDIGVIGPAAGSSSGYTAYLGDDPTNTSRAKLLVTSVKVALESGRTGTGTYKPLAINTGGADRVTIDTVGNVLAVSATGGLGYGAGAGGTVEQTPSKSTDVILNKPCGTIIMDDESLAAGASVYFNLNNTLISRGDTLNLGLWVGSVASTAAYRIENIFMAPQSAGFKVTNISAGTLSESLEINFVIHKGSNA